MQDGNGCGLLVILSGQAPVRQLWQGDGDGDGGSGDGDGDAGRQAGRKAGGRAAVVRMAGGWA